MTRGGRSTPTRFQQRGRTLRRRVDHNCGMGVDIMIRRGLRAFMVVALGVGLCAVHSTLAAGADSPYVYITNIAVQTPGDGATATYRLCVMTSDPPSLYGGVTIHDPAPSTSQ